MGICSSNPKAGAAAQNKKKSPEEIAREEARREFEQEIGEIESLQKQQQKAAKKAERSQQKQRQRRMPPAFPRTVGTASPQDHQHRPAFFRVFENHVGKF